MYINKQTTVKAGLNVKNIQNFTNVKMTFKNIFPNKMHIDFKIFCQQYIDKTSKPLSLYNIY